MPVPITDADMAIVLSLASPIDRERRPAFLQAVVAELEGAEAIGPGAVYRAAAKLQRAHFDPPADARQGVANRRA
jgi:hypothetical protein